ncbi:MAG: NHLP-related RiPP peptide [Acidimicrobiia bacterium]
MSNQAEAKKRPLFANLRVTPDDAKAFATALAEDDDFRAQLKQNPEEALARYGITIPPGQVKPPVELPSKEQLRKVLDSQEEAFWVFIAFGAFLAFFVE